MSEVPQFDEVVADNDQTSAGSSGSSGPTIPDVEEGVARLIIDAIKQRGGSKQTIELPAFSEDAPDFAEQYVEHYDLEGVETFSVEDLFGYDWSDYDYIGTPPVTDSDNVSEEEREKYTDDELKTASGDVKAYIIKPEYVEAFRDAKVLKGGVTPISKALNGRFADLITEAFGDDVKLSVGKGKKRNHQDAEEPAIEAMNHVAFWVSDSDNAAYQRRKAEMEAGNLSEDEFEQWAEANGYEDKL